MSVCDAHDAVWGVSKMIKSGEGYLLAARFMKNSAVQEKNLQVGERMGIPKEVYKQQIESIQGNSPWIICEQCVKFLKLGEKEKTAAHAAAVKWWRDKTVPGHMPKPATSPTKKPPAQTDSKRLNRKKWWHLF